MFKPMIVSLVLGLLLAPTSFAQLSMESSSGKVISGPSKGSGVIFREGTEVFMLTSEHVLNLEQSQTSEAIETIHGSFQATRVAADWGMGLALLKLSKFPGTAKIPQLSDLQPPTMTSGAKLTLVGYAHESKSLTTNSNATLTALASERHMLAEPEHLYEVDGNAEFGMSGGSVFVTTDKGKRWAGMLSNQALHLVQGSAEVTEFAKERVESRVFVIPASEIYRWTKTVLASPKSFQPTFQRKLDASGNEAVSTGGVIFQWKPKAQTAVKEGGGDGFGIGGDSDQKSLGFIELSLDSQQVVAPKNPSLAKWVQKARDSLLGARTLKIPYLVDKDASAAKVSQVQLRSLGQFFHQAIHENFTPILLFASDASGTYTGAMADISVSVEKSKLELSRLKKAGAGNAAVKQLLASAESLLDLLSGPLALSVTASDLMELAENENFDRAWQVLFNVEFDATVNFMREIRAAADKLDHLNQSARVSKK